MSEPTDIVLIAGSPSEPSRSTAALRLLREYIADEAAEDVRFTEFSVRALPADALLHADFAHPAIAAVAAAVQAADVVVISTPIYQAAYSGALKALLDLLPQEALAGKAAVLPVATGGSPGHLLAIEYALKPVLSALGARHVLTSIYLTAAQFSRGSGSGGFTVDESAESRLRRGAGELWRGVRRHRGGTTGQEAAPLALPGR